jgi:penicillin-binding protein 1C
MWRVKTISFQKKRMFYISVALVMFVLLCICVRIIDAHALSAYQALASEVLYDREGAVVHASLNKNEQVCFFASSYPDTVRNLVLRKEDQWFYYHLGINPYRTLLSLWSYISQNPSGGASTVTQQLAKVLLHNTTSRTFEHKVQELLLAFTLEVMHSKDEILTMYLNTVPLGGNIQGFPAASRAYFNKQVAELNENETLQLIAAFSKPNSARPLSETNLARAVELAQTLHTVSPLAYDTQKNKTDASWFELTDILSECSSCHTTLDVDLNERIRTLVHTQVSRGSEYGISHGAVVVISTRNNELLALVGSPNPNSTAEGMRINMALQTRPVGSTVKPFLYLLGFMKGLRPYTLVEDREYKFEIETGFPLYPKNYDGEYRGLVTLEESLANSLNVPVVEVLKYITLQETYPYLEQTLHFAPPQPWDSYAYGIALGGLELDLVTLTHAFTALAKNGSLERLVTAYRVSGEPFYFTPPHSSLIESTQIAPSDMVALVNAILSDRTAGVEQFGQSGSLHLSHDGYAVKTGTSRDYHDSWTVGYTADFVVGVWLGSALNTPMNKVSGSMGAGSVWHDVMELLYTTKYYTGKKLDLSPVVHVSNERGYSYGLASDNVEEARNLMQDTTLIRFPHHQDIFLYTKNMRIPLESSQDVRWVINDVALDSADAWYPQEAGTYTIQAQGKETSEEINVTISSDATIFQ